MEIRIFAPKMAIYGVVLIVGVMFFSTPFTQSGRTCPPWMRLALWMLAPVMFCWSTLGFILLFAAGQLSKHSYYFLQETKTLLSGMIIGVLTLLFISGEFVRMFGKKREKGAQLNIA